MELCNFGLTASYGFAAYAELVIYYSALKTLYKLSKNALHFCQGYKLGNRQIEAIHHLKLLEKMIYCYSRHF